MIKLCIERCRECTRFALFFSSSLMHSMMYLFLIIILSHTGISLFFILALSPWTNWIPWLNRLSKSSCFDVSSVSKYRPHSAVPVIYVCPCKTECYHFPGIIAEQMQLESMTPAHGTLSVLGKTSKDLARNSVLHCDIQESLCCQRTLCLYTCRRHGA